MDFDKNSSLEFLLAAAEKRIFPGGVAVGGWVAGLIENKASPVCSAKLKLETGA